MVEAGCYVEADIEILMSDDIFLSGDNWTSLVPRPPFSNPKGIWAREYSGAGEHRNVVCRAVKVAQPKVPYRRRPTSMHEIAEGKMTG